MRVSLKATGGTREKDSNGWEHYRWVCELGYNGKTLQVPEFKCGLGHATTPRWRVWDYPKGPKPIPIPPTAFDVLYSVVSDASSVANSADFEDWASDFGYDSDSRKAEAIYFKCQHEAKRLKEWLGYALYETLLGFDEDALKAWVEGAEEVAS